MCIADSFHDSLRKSKCISLHFSTLHTPRSPLMVSLVLGQLYCISIEHPYESSLTHFNNSFVLERTCVPAIG